MRKKQFYRFCSFLTLLFLFMTFSSFVEAANVAPYVTLAENIDTNSFIAPANTFSSTIIEDGVDISGNSNSLVINTYSPSCILIEASTGKVLYAKESKKQMYPASITKIMTAILTLENCTLDEIATVSHNAVYSIPSGYTFANLKEGEQLSIKDLLYAMMIPSANDAAIVLAEHVGGSVESFATMMNTKASELGCINTHFVNPNGIHNENHYSCAYDMALIGRYAMQNETFRQIVKTTRYTLPTSNMYDKTDRVFNTTNELLKENHSTSASNYYYPDCTGIKTGYTDPAKNCIVASAKRDGMELIVAILGAERTETGLSGRNLDCISLFNYGFENYEKQTICTAQSTVKTIKIGNATSETNELNLLAKDELFALVPKDFSVTDLQPDIKLNMDLKAPIAKNTVVGKLSYTIDGITYSTDLIAESDVFVSTTLYTILSILGIVLVLYLIYKITRPKKKKHKKKKTTPSSSGKRSSGKKSPYHISSKKSSSSRKGKHGNHRGNDNYLYW